MKGVSVLTSAAIQSLLKKRRSVDKETNQAVESITSTSESTNENEGTSAEKDQVMNVMTVSEKGKNQGGGEMTFVYQFFHLFFFIRIQNIATNVASMFMRTCRLFSIVVNSSKYVGNSGQMNNLT